MKYNFSNKHSIKNAKSIAISALIATSQIANMKHPVTDSKYSVHHNWSLTGIILSSILIFYLCWVIMFYPLPAYAIPTITFENPEYFLNDGAVGSILNPHIIVDDPAANLSPIDIDSVEVLVTSTTDTQGTTLTLTEIDPFTGLPDSNTGIFQNSNLIFMIGDNRFTIETVVIVSLDDATLNTDPITIETTDIVGIISSSDLTGLNPFELIETGPDTGVFTRRLQLTAGSTTDTTLSTLHVSEGDVLTVANTLSTQFTNCLIIPAPDGTVGAILASIGDTITAVYPGAVSATAMIGPDGPGGGGGGGVIRSEVIIEVLLAFLGGGWGGDKTPPSLTRPISGVAFDPFVPIEPVGISDVADTIQQAPLRINENAYPLYGYSNTITTNTVETGQFIDISLAFEEASKVSHVAIYFVDQDRYEHSDKDPALLFDNGNMIKIDPQGIFGDDINLSNSKEGTKSIFNFGVSFDKPTKKNLIIVAWDENRNSATTKVFNALEVTGNEIPDEEAHSLPIEEAGEFDLVKNDDGQYVLLLPVETKTVTDHPKTIVYPEWIGRHERHDDGFQYEIVQENIKAQTIAQEMIDNPFTTLDDRPAHLKFFFPSNVGKLDRENKDTLNDVMLKELVKATKIFSELYSTNHWKD